MAPRSKHSVRTIVVGDVHGCIDELDALLQKLALSREDRLILAGDLVAKGPDSAAVVERAIERGALAVRGNHDEHVLRWYRAPGDERDARAAKMKRAHLSVVESLEARHWQYLAALPTWLRFDEHTLLVVHAGLMPGVPLEQQREEDLLHLRSIQPDGSAGWRAHDGVPWASTWRGPEHVVFGHDAIRGLQLYPRAIGLDTGCVYGRELTAVVFPTLERLSVPAKRQYAPIDEATASGARSKTVC